jgi:hypothetical protein
LALDLADWSPIQTRSEVTVFDRRLSEAEAADAVRPFDVVCTPRGPIALPPTLIERLANLKLITIVGRSLPNLDMAAATMRRACRPLELRQSPIQLRPRRYSGTRLGADMWQASTACDSAFGHSQVLRRSSQSASERPASRTCRSAMVRARSASLSPSASSSSWCSSSECFS